MSIHSVGSLISYLMAFSSRLLVLLFRNCHEIVDQFHRGRAGPSATAHTCIMSRSEKFLHEALLWNGIWTSNFPVN